MSDYQGPLSRFTVIDLTRVRSGPTAVRHLADWGANVIKVEAPAAVDKSKGMGGARNGPDYQNIHRNKRSLTLNLKENAGRDVLMKLVTKADVVVENYRPDVKHRLGVDYDALRAANPRIILASISGFGQDGPYAKRPGFDQIAQGMGGLMSITGQPDDSLGGGPMKVGVAVCDLFTGMFAANAALAALAYRSRTGIGQHIDCALLDSQISMLANQSANWLNAEICPDRMGNSHPSVVPYTVYEAKDGFVIIACGNDKQFIRLTAALGIPALADDDDFASNEARIKNRNRLDTMLGDIIVKLDRVQVIDKLEIAGVSCGPINDIAEVFADPHVRARGARIDQQREDGSQISSTAFAAKLGVTPAQYRTAPPRLGQHNDQVMQEWAGLGADKVAALRAAKVM